MQELVAAFNEVVAALNQATNPQTGDLAQDIGMDVAKPGLGEIDFVGQLDCIELAEHVAQRRIEFNAVERRELAVEHDDITQMQIAMAFAHGTGGALGSRHGSGTVIMERE